MALQKRKIKVNDESELKPLEKKRPAKKVLYLEIDDEVTTVYDKLSKLKHKTVYLVMPQRAVLFQSAINLKILKRKADDLSKKIVIVTGDSSGFNLAKRVGLDVQEKLESEGNTQTVARKDTGESEITPLKASVNSLADDSPSRRNEKKFSISDLVKRGEQAFQIIPKNINLSKKENKKKEKSQGSTMVLIAPNKKALFGLVAVSLVILMAISYIALPGATLVLTPKSNVIEVPKNVILADAERNRAELDTRPSNMIPSYKITTQIDKVFTFQATGKDAQGGKTASGKVKIQNTSPNDWPLVPRTRFQTADGLVYRIDRQVVVPGGSAEKPGELEVTVSADTVDAFGQPTGERGNIKGEVKFFLPALSSENQKKIFAVSNGDFSGGVTNIIKFISKEDTEAARIKMENELRSSAEAELKALITKKNETQNTKLALLTGKNLIEYGAINVIIPPNIEGQKLDSFDVKGSLVVGGIAYDREELVSILNREIKLKKNPEKTIASVDEDSLTYKLVDYDKASQKVTITATIQGIEEFEVSPKKENGERLIKKVKESILGKDIKEAREFIQNLPEIEKVEISTWPAWAPTLPSVPDNIKVEIRR
jgi:hypothetical protein